MCNCYIVFEKEARKKCPLLKIEEEKIEDGSENVQAVSIATRLIETDGDIQRLQQVVDFKNTITITLSISQ